MLAAGEERGDWLNAQFSIPLLCSLPRSARRLDQQPGLPRAIEWLGNARGNRANEIENQIRKP
jgi:hypothetical protein